jgi:Holliday junction resolvase
MKAHRIDDNQKQIVNYLREHHISVAVTSGMGKGFPDLVCGYRGKNILLEIKDGKKPVYAQALTPEQHLWHHGWRGQIAVVNTPEMALDAIYKAVAQD